MIFDRTSRLRPAACLLRPAIRRRVKETVLTHEMNNANAVTDAHTESGFAALGISGPLLAATLKAGFAEPKPIQVAAIPAQIEGKDILGIAQTGSGKTAAFSLPILSKIIGIGTKRAPKSCRALILAPTRELAVQIEETIRTLAKGLHISTALVLGGVSRFSQVKRMAQGVDVLVATPGRLTDLVREGDITLSQTRWLVLDEADRMLDMGFIHDVRRIAKATHHERQTALFSATMPSEIESLARGILKNPVHVEVAPQGTAAGEITQSVVMARTKQKRKVLSEMLADESLSRIIIFARTKHGADRVARDLDRDGFEAAVIHGNKSQNARQRALNGFRDGSVRILVATDIAARGIDVQAVSHVINFDLPDEAESYVHRIGRTGRNGADGIAITLCDPSENSKLRQVERIIRTKLTIAASHLDQPDPAPQKRDPNEPRPEAANDDGDRREHRGARPGGRNGNARFSKKPGGGRGFGGKPGHAGHGGEGAPGGKKPFRAKRRGTAAGRKSAQRAA